jgi:hypothetical protein
VRIRAEVRIESEDAKQSGGPNEVGKMQNRAEVRMGLEDTELDLGVEFRVESERQIQTCRDEGDGLESE